MGWVDDPDGVEQEVTSPVADLNAILKRPCCHPLSGATHAQPGRVTPLTLGTHLEPPPIRETERAGLLTKRQERCEARLRTW